MDAVRTVAGARTVRELDDHDRRDLDRLIAADPLVNAVLASRLRGAVSMSPARLGGRLLGVHEGGELRAAVFSGGNLLPVGGDEQDWLLLAEHVAAGPRECTSIVGRSAAVRSFWDVLEPLWGPPRAVRPVQPLLVAEHPPAVPRDARVREVGPAEIERYLPAAVAMFTEELGVSPLESLGTGYRRRVDWLLRTHRAFGIVEADGSVVFKADLAALSADTCQIQGVWVRPDLRGTGLGTAALAAVLDHALRRAPSVSLYVNDFNLPARRLYARLGMREAATLATVLV